MRKTLSGRRCSTGFEYQFKVDLSNTGSGTSDTTTMILPFSTGTPSGGGTMAMNVDWGDGSSSQINSSNFATNREHIYSSTAIYVITITGNIRGWSFGAMSGGANQDDALKVTAINQWGDFVATETQCFRGCGNLAEIVCPDLPVFEQPDAGVGFLSEAFALKRINRVGEWDVSNMTNIRSMFFGCFNFDEDLSATGNIPNFSNWDVSNVTDMSYMFGSCTKLDTKVFQVTSTTTNLEAMFSNCQLFTNKNSSSIATWDTRNVINMSWMFNNAKVFNINISGWDTGLVTTMERMFGGLNNPMAFNQPIGAWNTSSVQNWDGMLYCCSNFDQDISNWDLSAINTIGSAGNSNQPLCSSISSSFQFPVVLSTANYDAALIQWDLDTYPSLPSGGGVLGFGLSKYSAAPSAAATAHASLVLKWGGISDGGPI